MNIHARGLVALVQTNGGLGSLDLGCSLTDMLYMYGNPRNLHPSCVHFLTRFLGPECSL
jgi:hypothetical protein